MLSALGTRAPRLQCKGGGRQWAAAAGCSGAQGPVSCWSEHPRHSPAARRLLDRAGRCLRRGGASAIMPNRTVVKPSVKPSIACQASSSILEVAESPSREPLCMAASSRGRSNSTRFAAAPQSALEFNHSRICCSSARKFRQCRLPCCAQACQPLAWSPTAQPTLDADACCWMRGAYTASLLLELWLPHGMPAAEAWCHGTLAYHAYRLQAAAERPSQSPAVSAAVAVPESACSRCTLGFALGLS